MQLEILDASWHRNGICGAGFYAVLFKDADQPGVMIASLFGEFGCCAVYSVDELARGNIAFACGNSWRGDYYEQKLRPLLDVFLAKQGSNRIGPFAAVSEDVLDEIMEEYKAK